MQLEDYFDFVGPDEVRLRGHRIGIEDVLRYYLEGYSPERIAEELPGLSLEQIHATITYYWHRKADVDGYLDRLTQRGEAGYQEWAARLPPEVQRLRALRAQQEREKRQSA